MEVAAWSRPDLGVVDTTLRDAHQCLWATRMTTAMMLPIASRMDEIGFAAIDLMGAVTFDVCVRYLRENPWERIRLMRQAIGRTPLNALVRSRSLISFDLMPEDVIELWVRRLAANGIRRITAFDGLHELDNLKPALRAARAEGLGMVGCLVYALSPVHTDALYATKAQGLLDLGVDAVMLKDPGGLLTAERVRTLIPAVRAVLGSTPLELHSHCPTGLGPQVYLEALPLGVDLVHTASSPLAHGPSQPPTEYVVKHAPRLGRRTALDPTALAEMAEHFRRVATRAGKALGQPAEYDPFHYEHQVPGGMITNLTAQLAQLGIAERLDEVLQEIARVREELGYLIMVTPFSQLVGTQAVLNVLGGERYRIIPNEVIKYAFGHYGQPAAPIDPEVMDRIAALPAARHLHAPEPLPPAVPRLRAAFGGSISDDELLLRIMFPEAAVVAMLAAGPIPLELPDTRQPLVDLVEAIASRPDVTSIHLSGEGSRSSRRVGVAP
ncbi:MAG TPA: pyruvate carboxylase subunit B [Methylomirabilota bacterium]|nr:pyruvate carboxylase subunit B [Methylomirabilota bacterium]